MKAAAIILLVVGVACCRTVAKKDTSFPLPYIEGKIEDSIVRLTSFADGPHPYSFESIGIEILRPEELRGKTVVFSFENRKDPDYKMLSENRGAQITVSAKDGKGCWFGAEIAFASKHHPIFKIKPNQAPEPTLTAVLFR
jgi:hypothetical protein